VQLAYAAYEERLLPEGLLDPARLAVLADALEEAGAPAALLEHLRSEGPSFAGAQHSMPYWVGVESRDKAGDTRSPARPRPRLQQGAQLVFGQGFRELAADEQDRPVVWLLGVDDPRG
jgi:hypothetical protein